VKARQFFAAFVLAAGALSGCNERSGIASAGCAELAAKKLSEAQQIELAKKCPRAGPPFKSSPLRNW
jgi:entry exclusion lipoprotein TrbK